MRLQYIKTESNILYLFSDLITNNASCPYLFSLRSNSTPTGCSYLNIIFSIDIAPLRGEKVLENLIEIRRKGNALSKTPIKNTNIY